MDQFKQEDSLAVISEMISVAKRSFVRMSYYFLLWGWLLLAAGLAEYVLGSVLDQGKFAWLGWPVVGVLGGILAMLRGRKESQSAGVATYMDRVFMYLWGGFVLTLVLLIVTSVSQKMNPGPAVMLLTGLPTFVSGGVMRFRPLIVGGVVFWALGVLAYFSGEYSSLLFCAAIAAGYLVPGYLLQKAERDGRV